MRQKNVFSGLPFSEGYDQGECRDMQKSTVYLPSRLTLDELKKRRFGDKAPDMPIREVSRSSER